MKHIKSLESKSEFYSIPDLAAITNESEAVWRKRILFKSIGYTKCGKNVRVSHRELQTWLASRTIVAKANGGRGDATL